MSLTGLIPAPWRWLALAVLGAALLAFGALQGARWQGNVDGVQIARLQADRAQERAAAALIAQHTEARYRAEEARRQKEAQDVVKEARTRAARAADDARRADHAAGELRDQLAAFVARARAAAGNPAAGGGSPPAADATGVLADMLAGVESAGRAMAAEADRRGSAGLACERQYDSLTEKR